MTLIPNVMVNNISTLSAADPVYSIRTRGWWLTSGVGLHLNDMKYHIDIEIKS